MICNLSFIPCLLNAAIRKNRGKKHLKDILDNISIHQGSVIEQNIVYFYIVISYYLSKKGAKPTFAPIHYEYLLIYLLTINRERHENEHEKQKRHSSV